MTLPRSVHVVAATRARGRQVRAISRAAREVSPEEVEAVRGMSRAEGTVTKRQVLHVSLYVDSPPSEAMTGPEQHLAAEVHRDDEGGVVAHGERLGRDESGPGRYVECRADAPRVGHEPSLRGHRRSPDQPAGQTDVHVVQGRHESTVVGRGPSRSLMHRVWPDRTSAAPALRANVNRSAQAPPHPMCVVCRRTRFGSPRGGCRSQPPRLGAVTRAEGPPAGRPQSGRRRCHLPERRTEGASLRHRIDPLARNDARRTAQASRRAGTAPGPVSRFRTRIERQQTGAQHRAAPGGVRAEPAGNWYRRP